MHLAKSLGLLALAFRSVCCAAADKAEPVTPVDKSVNAAAGPGVAVGVLGEFITNLLPSFISLFNEKEGKCKFVEKLTGDVFLEYRDLNVVVYSNPKSDDTGLVGKVCYSVDKQLAFFREQEYRVCIFETGKFTLAGDDKCENWHYRGCTDRTNGKTVSFCRRVPGATGAPGSSTTTKTTATTKSSTTKPTATSTKASTKTTSTTSSRPKSTTTSVRPTTPSQPGGGGPGTVATSTSAPPPPPPAAPPTSAGGNANTGAATTGGQSSAGSIGEPAIVRIFAALVAFMAMA